MKGAAWRWSVKSGSGKSTCAKLLTRMLRPTDGTIHFGGEDVTVLHGRSDLREYRRHVQMVFQDPFAALNPAHSVQHHLERPLALHKSKLSRAERTGRRVGAAAPGLNSTPPSLCANFRTS